MKTMLLAAAAALTLGVSSAYAGESGAQRRPGATSRWSQGLSGLVMWTSRPRIR